MSKNSRPTTIVPVILSRGSTNRLWPMSREAFPEHLLSLIGANTKDTDSAGLTFAAPIIVCKQEHRFPVATQLKELGIRPAAIIIEQPRGGALTSCAIAGLIAAVTDSQNILLIIPADHLVRDMEAFHTALIKGVDSARLGGIITFGVSTETAKNAEYWIHTDSTPIKNAHPRSVTRFERAGSPEQAQGFRENGQLLVHAGVTLVRAADFLREIESDKPEIISRARMALTSGRREMDFFHPDPAILFGAPDLSLEAGLLETSANIVVIPADFGWTDAKDWAVLWDVGVKDGDGNVTVGEVIARDTRGCYLRSEGPVTITAGIENLVVVSTDDAVLVATRDNVAQVQSLVEADMCDRATVETLGTRRIYQAWGYVQLLHGGPLFLVRRLAIKIGARLPLQRNPAQSSHLVVLNGTAMITRGTETVMIETNDSIHITQGMTFRIDNAGDVPLEIVEVLSERGEPL